MICPNCGKEIEYVVVTSKHFESVYFKEGKNEIDHDTWDHVGDGDPECANCPECDADIIEEIIA